MNHYYNLDTKREKMIKIKPIFAWYDFWVGFYWSSKTRTLYIMLIPCFGFSITTTLTQRGNDANNYIK